MGAPRSKRAEGGKGIRRPPGTPAPRGGHPAPTGEETHLAWGRKNFLLLGLGGIGLVVGFVLLAVGDTTLAPVLLVGSYLGLIPWGIVANERRPASSGERTSAPGRPAPGGE